jgi:hypothetical protein
MIGTPLLMQRRNPRLMRPFPPARRLQRGQRYTLRKLRSLPLTGTPKTLPAEAGRRLVSESRRERGLERHC